MALHGHAAQARIDPGEQQPHAVGDQVRQGAAGERPQFGAGEAGALGRLADVPERDRPFRRFMSFRGAGGGPPPTGDRRNSQYKIWHTEIRRFSGRV